MAKGSLRRVLALAVLVGLVAAGCSGSDAATQQTATLTILEGSATVDAGDGPLPATDGQSVGRGDTITTGPGGRAEIVWSEGSTTRLDYGTTFTVTIHDVSDGATTIRGEQTTGNTYHRVAVLSDTGSRFDIDTPTATAAVQGTEYALFLDPEGNTTIAVLDDTVLVEYQEFQVLVDEGFSLVVPPPGTGGGPAEPFPIPEEVLRSDWLSYNTGGLDDRQLQANVSRETVHTHGWDPGAALTLTIDDADGNRLKEIHLTLDEEGAIEIGPDRLGLDQGIRPGMVLTVVADEDPRQSRELVLRPGRFESYDADTHEIRGWAPELPTGEIRFHLADTEGAIEGPEGGPPSFRPGSAMFGFDVDAAGSPNAPGSLLDGLIEIPDEDNDGTFVSLPRISVADGPEGPRVFSVEFDDDTSVTVTVEPPDGDPTTVTVPVDGMGNFEVSLDMPPGTLVTVTGDDTGIVKHLTVDRLVLGGIDLAGSTISGTASPGAVLIVEAWIEGRGHDLAIRAGDDGAWVADFGAEGFTLEAGAMGRVRATDPDTDETQIEFEI